MKVEFGSAVAGPGRKAWGQLEVREGRKRVKLGVCAVNGAKPGNHVVLMANQHGVELNGIESIRRVCEEIDPQKLKGTVFAIPSMNPKAALLGRQAWVESKSAEKTREDNSYGTPYNMNFQWPGRKGDTLVARMAYEVWNRAVLAPHRRAAFVLDFHSHMNPTAAYAHNHMAAQLAVSAGVRNVIVTGDNGRIGMNSSVCTRNGIMGLTIELEAQGVFRAGSIEDGCRAIRNLLKFYGMLRGRLDLPDDTRMLDPWRCQRPSEKGPRRSWLDHKAKRAGLVISRKRQYDLVRKGETLGAILDPHAGRIVQTCKAGMGGALYHARTPKPHCAKGERLYTVCIVDRIQPREYVADLDRESFLDEERVKKDHEYMVSHHE